MGVTTLGKGLVVTAMSATYYLELGSGTTAFTAADTTLATAITTTGLARATAVATPAATSIMYAHTWTSASTTTIREVGLFNTATTGGTMFARTVLTTTRALVSGDGYTLQYTITYA